jgi:2-hydroxychromene-2-carboxylate isomerase
MGRAAAPDTKAPCAACPGATRSPEIQAAFLGCTERAIARGVPGSPTDVIDGEVFYGQRSSGA